VAAFGGSLLVYRAAMIVGVPLGMSLTLMLLYLRAWLRQRTTSR
jgi:hypothetical protein